MDINMEEKFKEAFILFSSCNDFIDIYRFYDLMHSFGIVLSEDEKLDLPDTISKEYWLDFAKKHFNENDPFKIVKSMHEGKQGVQINVNNFIAVS
ncbi:conserved protein, unknown function [Hepatocystis sp. ex Piliocolobus tephrosceles]|nr:conserved protein, unknown function [Hepatocystis sp. ex Piliocolobus tephrosceles]